MSKRFSLLKILIVVFFCGRESSNDPILVFFGNFVDRSSGFDDGYFLRRGTGWGVSRERGKFCVGGAGHGHVSFLSATETASFLETFIPFLRGQFLWSFIDVDVHGIGVPGGSVSGEGGVMESDRSPG